MNTFSRLILIAPLVVLTPGCSQQVQLPSGTLGHNKMTSVITTVKIAGAPEPVFDLVTTARFWPQWHPATMAVGGVTERPYRFGDRIYERGRIGNQDFETSWKVVEYIRPSRVVLQSQMNT
jgi:uncharacterized protein YndB with AHSA1/START domain